MCCIWKYVRCALALLGLVFLAGAAGTSDFHVIGLGQADPSSCWKLAVIGVVLILPEIIQAIYEAMTGREEE